jgi:hypothetical protein
VKIRLTLTRVRQEARTVSLYSSTALSRMIHSYLSANGVLFASAVVSRHFTNSISLGRHAFVKNGSSGLYRRSMALMPLPEAV